MSRVTSALACVPTALWAAHTMAFSAHTFAWVPLQLYAHEGIARARALPSDRFFFAFRVRNL